MAAADPKVISDLDDPVVKFKTDLSYGCTKAFTYDEFKAFCSGGATTQKAIKDYEIFKALQ